MACNVSPGSSKFMFVEYAAPKVPVAGEKKRRGGPREVRQHITTQFHRQMRLKRLGSLKGAQEGGVRLVERPKRGSDATEDGEEEDDEDEEEAADWAKGRVGDGAGTAADFARLRGAFTQRKAAPQKSDVSRGLQSLLGEGRMDPFDVLPASNMPLLIHRVLDHALIHSWPNTVPTKSMVRTNPVKKAWLKDAMDHPVLFHGFIYATAMHMLYVYKGREISPSAPAMRLSHLVKTIRLVNDELRNLEGPSSDALILVTAMLAIHGGRDDREHPEAHPRSPLAEAQQLHIYGGLQNDEKHVLGIRELINRKGGLDGIKMFALADTMQLCDLYFASKWVLRPVCPWRHGTESLVASGRHVLDSAAIALESKLGTGFEFLRGTPAGQDLLAALDSVLDVTIAVDHYIRGGPTAPELVDLIEARNFAQHRLTLQNPDHLDLSDGNSGVLHAVRLAVLIYSDMVIFPLPAIQGVKPRLALLLQQALSACTLHSCWDLHAPVLLWALTLGAIGASFTPQREWYLEQLARQSLLIQIQSWAALESLCAAFLWWVPVCSEPGQQVWDDMFPHRLEAT